MYKENHLREAFIHERKREKEGAKEREGGRGEEKTAYLSRIYDRSLRPRRSSTSFISRSNVGDLTKAWRSSAAAVSQRVINYPDSFGAARVIIN